MHAHAHMPTRPHAHTRPGHASCSLLLPPTSTLFPPFPPGKHSIVPRQLGSFRGQELPFRLPTLFPLPSPVLIIPPSATPNLTLAWNRASPVNLSVYLSVCLSVCLSTLSTLLTCPSRLVLSCPVPHSCFTFITRYSASPSSDLPDPPLLLHRYRNYHRAPCTVELPDSYLVSSRTLQPAVYISICPWLAISPPCMHAVLHWRLHHLAPNPNPHPTAVQLQHVSLSLVGLGGGWSGPGCTAELPAYRAFTFIFTRKQTIIHLPWAGLRWDSPGHVFPFPIPRVCWNLHQVLHETGVAWRVGFTFDCHI